MKNFLLKIKKQISEIFNLKSKSFTILLGTLVPFFAAHIMAYTGKEVKGGKYLPNFYLSFFLFLILYSIEIVGFIVCFHTPEIVLYLILLAMYILANWVISILFYGIIMDKRKN